MGEFGRLGSGLRPRQFATARRSRECAERKRCVDGASPSAALSDPTVRSSSDKAEGEAQALFTIQTPPADLGDQASDGGKVLSPLVCTSSPGSDSPSADLGGDSPAVVSEVNPGEMSAMDVESAEDPLNLDRLFEENM